MGCGTGRFLRDLLLRHLPKAAVYSSLDISPRIVSPARARLTRFGFRAAVLLTDGDVRLVSVDERLDRVVRTYVLDLLAAGDPRGSHTRPRTVGSERRAEEAARGVGPLRAHPRVFLPRHGDRRRRVGLDPGVGQEIADVDTEIQAVDGRPVRFPGILRSLWKRPRQSEAATATAGPDRRVPKRAGGPPTCS